MRQVGIFSGSFNPIHIGHLALANYLCEFESLDEVWFVVTPRNPWKEEDELLPDDLRLRLVELSIDGYPSFKASDFEFHLPVPSYTIHLLDSLHESYPDISFSLIIGADNWVQFDKWRDYRRIISEHDIYVYPRIGYSITDVATLPSTVHIMQSPILDISSSFIRSAIADSKDLRFFLHPEAWLYLKNHYLNH